MWTYLNSTSPLDKAWRSFQWVGCGAVEACEEGSAALRCCCLSCMEASVLGLLLMLRLSRCAVAAELMHPVFLLAVVFVGRIRGCDQQVTSYLFLSAGGSCKTWNSVIMSTHTYCCTKIACLFLTAVGLIIACQGLICITFNVNQSNVLGIYVEWFRCKWWEVLSVTHAESQFLFMPTEFMCSWCSNWIMWPIGPEGSGRTKYGWCAPGCDSHWYRCIYTLVEQ